MNQSKYNMFQRDIEDELLSVAAEAGMGVVVYSPLAQGLLTNRYLTDISGQDALNRVWAEYFGDSKPATTTFQVVELATDPRCLIEINAVAIID